MNLADFIDTLSQLGPITYDTPFDEKTLVFRIGGKIFLLTDIEQWDVNTPQINIKALPDNVEKYVSEYDFVSPGYHMNKKHWVTINLNQTNNSELVMEWIINSYQLVYKSLTQKSKTDLEQKK